jgi:tRNA modification GTPase
MLRKDETICAPATGKGGAISIIRMSGPQSITICEKIFRAADGKSKLCEQKGYSTIYGEIVDSDEIIDDVIISIYITPHSYTGENSVEISCHGSHYVQTRIMELLIRNGALAANPGEFTQRAFMNGKMDLSQAEAVADLIASSSAASHRLAINQMRGGFSKEISKLRGELLHFASLIELELDFGEEDVVFADRKQLQMVVRKVKDTSHGLTDSFRIGNAVKNGIPVAIAGKPNSGKSTLLNALLMEDRAIVSEIPGTTRDAIEDTIVIDGIEYRFVDTAGLRETSDVIETIGIRKTHEKIEQASIIILVDEIYDDPESINYRAERIREIAGNSDQKLIVVINKEDLAAEHQKDNLQKNLIVNEGEALLFISAREKHGLDELRKKLGELVERERLGSENVIVTNMRHFEALSRVTESLERVEAGLLAGIPEDLIAIDIRQAIHYLGEITGEITTDEILGNIFRNFCIGK